MQPAKAASRADAYRAVRVLILCAAFFRAPVTSEARLSNASNRLSFWLVRCCGLVLREAGFLALFFMKHSALSRTCWPEAPVCRRNGSYIPSRLHVAVGTGKVMCIRCGLRHWGCDAPIALRPRRRLAVTRRLRVVSTLYIGRPIG
jgi:hypothetical protein